MFGEERRIRPSLSLLAVVLLVLANGFFVATEFALVSVRRTRIQQLASDGNRRARQVLNELRDLDTHIAATQLGIAIASLALGWIGGSAVASFVEQLLGMVHGIPEASREAVTHTISFILAFSFITTLHIVVRDQTPKSIVLQPAEQTAPLAARPIHLLYLALRPAIHVLNSVGDAVVPMFGIEPASGRQLVQTAEELRMTVSASRDAELVEESEHDLVDRALLFPDLEAEHALVPCTEIAAVPIKSGLDDVIQAPMSAGHSQSHVYEGELDHPIGEINAKRLLPLLVAARSTGTAVNDQSFKLRDLITDGLAVPETSPASALLPQLRGAHTPVAILIDEYGGTPRLVTIVDLVECLVGDITDDLDAVSPNGLRAAGGSFLLDRLTTLLEAREFYDLTFGEDVEVETVGGHVFGSLGRPAVVGDEIETADKHVLRVEELDGLRVARNRVLPATRRSVFEAALLGAAA
ncbi:MAG: hemolysin family protein [Chloroflexi bacterium]|nr:hemolysin family protein [Chloroflexota bacterium]